MTRNSDQGASALKVWSPGHFPFGLQPWHNIFKRFHATARGTRATWHVAPRDRRHRRSVAPAHRMSRLPSGSAQLFRRYSRNPYLRWPLACGNTAESSAHFCHQMSATPLSRGEYGLCLIWLCTCPWLEKPGGGERGKVYPGPQKWKNDGGDGGEPTIHKTGPFHGLCLSFAIPQRQAQGAMGPFQNWKGPSERSKGPLSAWEGPFGAWKDPMRAKRALWALKRALWHLKGPSEWLKGPSERLKGPFQRLEGPLSAQKVGPLQAGSPRAPNPFLQPCTCLWLCVKFIFTFCVLARK